MGKEAFSKGKELLRGKLKKTLKKEVIKIDMEHDVIWIKNMDMRKVDIKRLDALKMWNWWRMEHITNSEVLKGAGKIYL